MTSQKIRQYLTLACNSPIPKLLFLIILSKKNLKNMAALQPRPTHILYQCAKFGDDRTSSFVTCATFDTYKAYANISIFLASKVCPMLKYSDIYDL